MSPPRSKRVAVSFSEHEHAQLQAAAHKRRVPLAALIAGLARDHLDAPTTNASETEDAPEATSGPTRTPAWLPPASSSARADWARSRSSAVQALLERYPTELSALDEGWAKDAAVREQLWALTVWRDLLDTGAFEDPRMELAFAHAFADFAAYLRERPRSTARLRR